MSVKLSHFPKGRQNYKMIPKAVSSSISAVIIVCIKFPESTTEKSFANFESIISY